MRRTEPALRRGDRNGFEVAVSGQSGLILLRRDEADGLFLILVQLKGSGICDIAGVSSPSVRGRRWQQVLTTEDASFCQDSRPLCITLTSDGPRVEFERAGAVIFRG